MKNRNYSKILVLALSVALLIGAVVGIVASAESAPEIIGKNIQYGADLKFQIAIDADSVGGAGKTVYVKTYADETKATLLDTVVAEYKDTSSTNLGVANAYVALSKNSISALAYNTEFYIVAECDGKETAITYSAIEYFLERLYGDDVTNATTEKGKAQKALYNNAISYGSSAQTLAALEGKYEGKNVADYLYYAVDGKTGIGLKGDEITLGAYTGNEANFSRWIVSDLASGNRLATLKVGDKFTLSANTLVAPYFGFRGTGDYYESAQKYDFEGSALANNGYANINTGKQDIVFGATTGEYATITKVDGDNALEFGSLAQGDPYLSVFNSYSGLVTTQNDTYVFETDIFIDNIGTAYNLQFYPACTQTAVDALSGANFNFAYDSTAGKFYITNGNSEKNYIEMDEWFNFKVVAEDLKSDSANIKYYVNGTLVCTKAFAKTDRNVNAMHIRFAWSDTAAKVYFDNLYFANVEETGDMKDAVPTVSANFAGERGTGVYYNKALTYTGVTATDLYNSKCLTSAADTSEIYNVDNAFKINPVIVKNVDGDAALEIVKNNNHSPKLITRSENKGYTVNADCDDFVVEFDICFDSLTRSQAGESRTTLFWMNIDKGYSETFNPAYRVSGFAIKQDSQTEGSPYFAFGSGKVADFAFDTWYNIRIEYDNVSSNSGTCTMYINNVKVGTANVNTNFAMETAASVAFFNSWDETNGKVYLDNLYFGTK